ncbi:hypothetical protein [Fulvivirga sedimenti]|uniref:Uncharacterized protein n=1 Tax=Fulvivirga sedimenti TaxID=2879465 RepID=A0A9X1HYK4_9BACT|nr:hypothetical protein [Fulvivirga sedimenti]MCA6078952.1 hypothetical protein [Fulvivirga sedimenti]
MNAKNAVYQIRLAGKITPILINYIDDMQIRQEIGQDTISLVGWLPDQSALLGLLNALNDIHYEILSVNAVNTNIDTHLQE